MKNKTGKVTVWERYFTKEIGIEMKACLYFFAILFYYCCYRLYIGIFDASILHMTEMIALVYIMGYIQTYLLWNFDEGENIGVREIMAAILCTAVYSLLAFLFGWFDKNVGVLIGFALYILFMFAVMIGIFKYRRYIDDKILNEELNAFQSRNKEE